MTRCFIPPMEKEVAWMAGLFEGEGTAYIQKVKGKRIVARVRIRMTDEDVIARFSDYMNISFRKVVGHRNATYKHKKPLFECEMTSVKAVDFLKLVRPFMGIRRSCKIASILEELNIQGAT